MATITNGATHIPTSENLQILEIIFHMCNQPTLSMHELHENDVTINIAEEIMDTKTMQV